MLHHDYLVLTIRFFLLLFLYTFRYFSLSQREVLVLVQILVLYPVCTPNGCFGLTAAVTVYPGDSAVQLSADIPSGLLARTRVPSCVRTTYGAAPTDQYLVLSRVRIIHSIYPIPHL